MSYTGPVLSGASETPTRWINSIEENREDVRRFYVSHKIVFSHTRRPWCSLHQYNCGHHWKVENVNISILFAKEEGF